MPKRKVEMNRTQYNFWLAAARERHGGNMLDWPKHIRDYHNNIRLQSEKHTAEQNAFPYGNTGVK